MSLLSWKLHGNGKTVKDGDVVKPGERLAWPLTIGVGVQHIAAMFGATFLVPIITGFPPSTTLFFSGVGTLLFLILTKNRVPSYLGSSFAFLAPIAAAQASGGFAVALGGVFATGVMLAVVGLIVNAVGIGWINWLLPPLVTGSIVMIIGFNLAGANEVYLADFKRAGTRDSLHAMIRSDFEHYLPGDLLVKADLATMANSLELRSPLLDHDVIEWANSLPAKFKVTGSESKHILKDIARSLVPAEIIDRPKMGFGIPRAEWLRTGMKELVIDTLTDTTATQRGWFNPSEVKKVIDTHIAGEDKDNIIWPMLMLELWARTWLD